MSASWATEVAASTATAQSTRKVRRLRFLVSRIGIVLCCGVSCNCSLELINHSQCTNRGAIDSLNLQWKSNKLEFLPNQFVEISETLNDRDVSPKQYFVNRPRLLLVCRVHPVLAGTAFVVLQARRVAAHAAYPMLYQPFRGFFGKKGLREHSAWLGLGLGEQEK